MTVSFSGTSVNGTVLPPSSKSCTHRAFFLAALADGTSMISNPLMSADTLSTLDSVRSLGVNATERRDGIRITGGNLHAPDGPVDAGNSGTTMRIMTGVSSIFDREVVITGDASLRRRPMGPLLDALRQMGVRTSSDNGMPPVSVTGPNRGGRVDIDGSISSQFVSALMIAAPMLDDDTVITVRNGLASKPYVDISGRMMSVFGASHRTDGDTIAIRGGNGYTAHDYRVPSDFSSAAFPLVAGALSGRVSVNGMDMNGPQGDRRIVEILRMAGASVTVEKDVITAERSDLHSIDIDMRETPDLFPIVSVLLCTAKGRSRLYGASQLRFKESDRIDTVVRMLKALGADIEGTEDGCVINGVKELEGGRVDNAGDHRVMMSAAVASLVSKKPVTMDDGGCCAVSYPSFADHMRELGMEVI